MDSSTLSNIGVGTPQLNALSNDAQKYNEKERTSRGDLDDNPCERKRAQFGQSTDGKFKSRIRKKSCEKFMERSFVGRERESRKI